MINLGRVASSPRFAQSNVLTRTTSSFVRGGISTSTTQVPFFGIIKPATDRDLRVLPEADRIEGMLLLISEQELLGTRPAMNGQPEGLGDTLVWQGALYRIKTSRQDVDFGFYKGYAAYQGPAS